MFDLEKEQILDEEEIQIQRDMETGLFEIVTDEKRINEVVESAKEYTRQRKIKDKLITFRMESEDVVKLKNVADNVGLDYQTLLRFVTKQLINRQIVIDVRQVLC
jgi:predicted DNA binding CopG/RHH family protein